MARPWRVLGPLEAMDGMLMARLSAAILFAVLHRLVERRLTDPASRPAAAAGGTRRLASGRREAERCPGPHGLDSDHA
jgi:hypothetical protein